MPIYTIALGTTAAVVTGPGGQLIPVPPDPEAMRRIAEVSGGEAFSAQDDDELDSVYERLGSQLGTKDEKREITAGFAAGGAGAAAARRGAVAALDRSPAVSRALAAALAVLAVAAVVAVVSLGGDDTQPAREPAPRPAPRPQAAAPLTHLTALQRLADRNGGNRAAGTAGDRASARYVASRLRRAGYSVRLQRVRFPFFDERARPQLVVGGRRLSGVSTLRYSGSGNVSGPLRAVDLRPPGVQGERDSGCRTSDFAGFPRGGVALIERGTCQLSLKVANAGRAGAVGALIHNDGRPGRSGTIEGTLGGPPARIPALFITHPTGQLLAARAGERVRIEVDAASETRTTHNVVADLEGVTDEVAMAGAHIDSVTRGPGINDNGSGVATLLAAGEELAASGGPHKRAVRLGFWGAEELGLIGSRRYVRGLSRAERRRIAGYLNLDMLGSGNGGRFVYSGEDRRSADLARAARRALARGGVPSRRHGLGARGSDHAPFAAAGIPVAGLFSGASSVKDEAERRLWGGRANAPFDRCYHLRCDRLGGIDRRALRELSGAAGATLRAMARGAA